MTMIIIVTSLRGARINCKVRRTFLRRGNLLISMINLHRYQCSKSIYALLLFLLCNKEIATEICLIFLTRVSLRKRIFPRNDVTLGFYFATARLPRKYA